MKHAMIRSTILLSWLAVPTIGILAAPALKERKDDDRNAIAGRWVQESISQRGGEPQPGQSNVFRLSKDGTCGLTTGAQGATETPGEFSLDPSKSPRRMKWFHGPHRTEWTVLYQLDGDKLKMAFVDQSTEIPQNIEPATNLTIYYLKRIKD
jgi:uncharacterized protein (TIGR03067 family)